MKQSLDSIRENYLNVTQSTAIKGWLAMGVLLCHVVPASGVVNGSFLSPLIASLGYLCVAMFFFLSGSGLAAQYQTKRDAYLKRFLKNRVLSIYLLTLFLILVYLVFRLLVGVQVSVIQLLQSFLFGNTIVSNGWYLQVILLFYLFWYLTTKFIKNERMQTVVLSVSVLAYMLFGLLFLSSFWYQSCLGFLLGIWWQKNKQKIDDWLFLKGKRLFLLAISFLAFCITYALAYRSVISRMDLLGVEFLATPKNFFTQTLFPSPVSMVFSCLSATAFVVLVLTINMIFVKQINCSVLRFIGKCSMEIYVLQGIPLHIFKTGVLKIENGWLYIVCVIAATVILAVIMQPIIRVITNIPKKYL